MSARNAGDDKGLTFSKIWGGLWSLPFEKSCFIISVYFATLAASFGAGMFLGKVEGRGASQADLVGLENKNAQAQAQIEYLEKEIIAREQQLITKEQQLEGFMAVFARTDELLSRCRDEESKLKSNLVELNLKSKNCDFIRQKIDQAEEKMGWQHCSEAVVIRLGTKKGCREESREELAQILNAYQQQLVACN